MSAATPTTPTTPPAPDWRAIKEAIGARLGIQRGYRTDGWARQNVSSPFRTDAHPSCTYNIESGCLYDHGTGETHTLRDLCAWFGLEMPTRRRRKAIDKRGLERAPSGDEPRRDSPPPNLPHGVGEAYPPSLQSGEGVRGWGSPDEASAWGDDIPEVALPPFAADLRVCVRYLSEVEIFASDSTTATETTVGAQPTTGMTTTVGAQPTTGITATVGARHAVPLHSAPDQPQCGVDTPLGVPTEGGMMARKAWLIRSAMGTGKTTFILETLRPALARQLGREPKILMLTHLQSLAANIASRFEQAGLEMHLYSDYQREFLGIAGNLAMSFNSLWKLAEHNNHVPRYDLIVIDEIEQFLRHLGGGTMRKNQAALAYDTLQRLIRTGGLVVGMDAHASNTAKQWLSEIAHTEAFALENIYQHPWGDLTLHRHLETVIAAAAAKITEGNGVVVIPCSSRSASEVIHQYLIGQFGAAHGKLINGDNSQQAENQRFIREINTALPALRWLVCSPSLATGLDVTCPVAGVYGIFYNTPLIPTDFLQMLGRWRSAAERHAYVQSAERDDPTDWQTLAATQMYAAYRTSSLSGFSQYRLSFATPTQHHINTLLAKLRADENIQRNHMLAQFTARARQEGFTLRFHEGTSEATRQALRTTRETMLEARKGRILNADPVDHAAMDLHRRAGTLTPEVRDGYERFKMEDCAGQTLTPEMYDDLHKPAQREALRRFTNLLEPLKALQARDREQADHLLIKRRHYTANSLLIAEALTAVWGKQAVKAITGRADLAALAMVTAGEVVERLQPFLTHRLEQLQAYLDMRGDLSTQPIPVLRRVMRHIGLRLGAKQVMRHKERIMVYWIEAENVAKMLCYAASRLQHLYAPINAREEHTLSRERRSSPVENLPDEAATSGDVCFDTVFSTSGTGEIALWRQFIAAGVL
ncbi:MAG: hypothetical protein OHK0046_42820 [Anaerolineae bacterium]